MSDRRSGAPSWAAVRIWCSASPILPIPILAAKGQALHTSGGGSEHRGHRARDTLAGERNSRKGSRRPLRQDPDRLHQSSGYGAGWACVRTRPQHIGRRADDGVGKGAAVFKTLNQTSAENMEKASLYPIRPVMFIAGDDEARKLVVLSLVAK